MAADSTTPESQDEDDTDESSVTMGGMAPTNAVTDKWVTASPKADATDPTTLPKAVADDIDGTDHSGDAPQADTGGQVFDESVAEANRGPAE